jgi:uncharacterized membrane protein YcgQ (UPF0703/DUF1980 family)
MKNKGIKTLIGFLLIVFGLTSLIMELIGIQWAFLAFLQMGGRLLGFVIKIIMTVAGFMFVYFAQTDWEEEKRESM